MSLVDFIKNNLYTDNPIVQSICIGILFMIIYDFYHLLFSSVTSWFKK